MRHQKLKVANLAEGERLFSQITAKGFRSDPTVVQDLGSPNSAASDNDGLRPDEDIPIALEVADQNAGDRRWIIKKREYPRDTGFGREGESIALDSVTEDGIGSAPSDIIGVVRATANGKRQGLNAVSQFRLESIQDNVVADRVVILIGSNVQDRLRAVEQCVEFLRVNGVVLAFLRVRPRACTGPVSGHATNGASDSTGLQIELRSLVRIEAVADKGFPGRRCPTLPI